MLKKTLDDDIKPELKELRHEVSQTRTEMYQMRDDLNGHIDRIHDLLRDNMARGKIKFSDGTPSGRGKKAQPLSI